MNRTFIGIRPTARCTVVILSEAKNLAEILRFAQNDGWTGIRMSGIR